MNVERTIEFLLSHAARSEARFDKIDGRLDRLAASQAKTEATLRRAIRLAVQRDRAVRAELRAMREAQQRTDRRFERWLDEMRRHRTDGHGR